MPHPQGEALDQMADDLQECQRRRERELNTYLTRYFAVASSLLVGLGLGYWIWA